MIISKEPWEDFAGGPVAKNMPINTGDMGSIHGRGRSHIAAEQLTPCITITGPVLYSPCATTTEPMCWNC